MVCPWYRYMYISITLLRKKTLSVLKDAIILLFEEIFLCVTFTDMGTSRFL